VLVAPDRTLAEDATFGSRRLVPFLLILALALAGMYFSLSFSRSPAIVDLTTREALARIDRMMASAPPEQREETRQRALQSMQNQSPAIAFVTGGVFVVLQWLATVLQIWLLFILVPQFLGGEEQPVGSKRHRRTQYLAIFACVPLAVQDLLRGIVLSTMDPTRLANVTTLAQFQEAAEVNLSLLYLAGLTFRAVPALPRGLLLNLTNPFVLWAGYVLVWGGAAILRLTKAKAGLVSAIVLLLFSLEGAALAQLGRLFGGS
jgi:hypothetical protein